MNARGGGKLMQRHEHQAVHAVTPGLKEEATAVMDTCSL